MHIKIFMASASNIQEREVLLSFAAGVEKWIKSDSGQQDQFTNVTRIGRWASVDPNKNQVTYEYAEAYRDCDVAVIFGSWKPREKGTHQTRTAVANSAKRFICIETPLLNRVTNEENTSWRIGVNGFLNLDAHWPELTDSTADRRLEQMGIKWNGWKSNRKGHALVALQLPGDASLRGMDINDWAYRAITDIRDQSDRRIVLRNHPLSSNRAFIDHESLARQLLVDGITNIKFSDGAIVPWAEDLNGAYCTVTYTSGLAIDSVLAGIPTIACDVGNFAWGLSTNLPSEINQLRLASDNEVWAWLRNIAGCQWSTVEMQDGTAWNNLLPVIESIK